MGLGLKDPKHVMPKVKVQMDKNMDSNMETLFLGV